MKVFKIILCFFIIISFVSCGTNEFYNISAFVDKYNKTGNPQIKISDFYFQSSKGNKYTAVFGNEGDEVLMTLKCSNSENIQEVNISIIKENNNFSSMQQSELFRNILLNTICTYCSYNTQTVSDIITDFKLTDDITLQKEGELTLKRDNFYFVYYSTKHISQFMIYNTYLHKIEATEKPVSKPYYAEDFIVKEKETP